MDLDISSADSHRKHRKGVPSKGKNRPIIVKVVRYVGRRHVFTKETETGRKEYVNY